MEAVIVVLVLALLAMAGVAVWLLTQQNRKPAEDPAAQRLERQLVDMKGELTRALTESRNTVLQQLNAVDTRVVGSLASSQEMMGRVHKDLGGLGESAKRMAETEQTLGKDVSSLKEILQPPKLRGTFGELLLEELLRQTLPASSYSAKHRFSDNTVVDFVIHTPDGLVPVDSKFPLESFKRLLQATSDEEEARERRAFMREMRGRIEEVAKYIRPDENTLDFAIMYVPAENIYYEALVGTGGESVMSFALERQVQLTSPNTFHAMLQVVQRALARIEIQQNALEIQGRLDQLKRDFTRFRAEFGKLGLHLGHAKNKYDDVDKRAARFGDRLSLAAQTELPELDEPVQPPLPDPELGLPQMEPARTNGSDN